RSVGCQPRRHSHAGPSLTRTDLGIPGWCWPVNPWDLKRTDPGKKNQALSKGNFFPRRCRWRIALAAVLLSHSRAVAYFSRASHVSGSRRIEMLRERSLKDFG